MQLMPHQIEDAQFLADRQIAGCFNSMGTGKSLTALEAVKLVGATSVVIIAPPIALPMWRDVSSDWLGLDASIISTGATPLPLSGVIVLSYVIATRRAKELAAWVEGTKSVLICDESHALKSTKAQRTKAILGRGGIVTAFDHAWFLTGTPVVRWNDDAIPFLFRAAPDAVKAEIGSLNIDRFNLKFCIVQTKKYPGARFPVRVTVGSTDEKTLGAIMSTVATRRTLEDVWQDMPPLTHTRLEVEPSFAIPALDEMSSSQIEREMSANTEHLATIRREMGLSMVSASAEYISDRIESGLPVVVGAWHTEVIENLAEALRAKGHVGHIIDGHVSAKAKEQTVADWNDGKLDFVVGQIGAMGVSLNMQRGGNNIVVVEEDFSPAVMQQFYARLHRMGQERPVHVDTLYVDNKLAKAIRRIAEAKRRSHAVLGDATEGKE